MKIINQALSGIVVYQPNIFHDERGYFFESFNEKLFHELIDEKVNFVQDNQSLSHKNVLRGLHFQIPPFSQGKLVRVLRGAVLDIAVDIRKNSDTYGQYFSCELNDENNHMMYIPSGFAHGFLSLADHTLFSYKCTNYYHKESERTIAWNDNTINIDWNIKNPIVSAKDMDATALKDFISPF